MKKLLNIRKFIIIILSVTIVLMGIGFIVISNKYYNLNNKENSFNVEFINSKKVNSIKGGSTEPTGKISISSSGKILDMKLKLYSKYDELNYEVTVKNTGTIDAEIVDIMMSPDFIKDYKNTIKPVEITMNDISGKILEAGEETTIKISAKQNDSSSNISNIKFKLGIVASSNK